MQDVDPSTLAIVQPAATSSPARNVQVVPLSVKCATPAALSASQPFGVQSITRLRPRVHTADWPLTHMV